MKTVTVCTISNRFTSVVIAQKVSNFIDQVGRENVEELFRSRNGAGIYVVNSAYNTTTSKVIFYIHKYKASEYVYSTIHRNKEIRLVVYFKLIKTNSGFEIPSIYYYKKNRKIFLNIIDSVEETLQQGIVDQISEVIK